MHVILCTLVLETLDSMLGCTASASRAYIEVYTVKKLITRVYSSTVACQDTVFELQPGHALDCQLKTDSLDLD